MSQLRVAIYKDTLANNRGADIAIRNLARGLTARGYDVTLFERQDFAAKMRTTYDVLISTGTNELLDIDSHFSHTLIDGRYPIPVIQQFHTDPQYAFRHWIKKWRRNWRIRKALRKCSAVQVLRQEHSEWLQKIIPQIPVSVIGNWSSFEEDNGNTTSKAIPSVIVYPAAVNKDKNQKLLLAAFDSIKSDFPDWRLELYGKGTPNGFCDLRSIYPNCAFVAFPSKTEGFGLVIVDAARYGKPCVMIKDWIGTGSSGGGLVTGSSIADYAAGLRQLMSNPELCRQMGIKAKAYCAEHYSQNVILDQWESLLRRQL